MSAQPILCVVAPAIVVGADKKRSCVLQLNRDLRARLYCLQDNWLTPPLLTAHAKVPRITALNQKCGAAT